MTRKQSNDTLMMINPGIIAVDEAGRGPWAGPVVAGAVVVWDDSLNHQMPLYWQDSKTLSARKRNTAFAQINHLCARGYMLAATGLASHQEIDDLNILKATFLAMKRAVIHLLTQCTSAQKAKLCGLWVDGNRLPDWHQDLFLPDAVRQNARAIIDGDALHPIIGAASVMAKVTRDELMAHYDKEFPLYGFARHQGYGTKVHQQALIAHGACAIHRQSFAPIKALATEI